MERTTTFLGHTVTSDPVQARSALQIKAEHGYITPQAYWALLQSYWLDMTEEDKQEELAILE